MRSILIAIGSLVLLIGAYNLSCAQSLVGPIELDPAFGSAGVIETDFGGLDELTSLYAVPHGKYNRYAPIVVAGKVRVPNSTKIMFGMVRFTPEGLPDVSFATNGRVTRSWDFIDYPNYLMVIDSSYGGPIIAAGASAASDAPTDLLPALYRFKSNGEPDSSFGVAGRVAARYDNGSGGEFLIVDSMIVNSTFRLLAIGYSASGNNASTYHFAAMRFMQNGTLDSSFGTNGKMVVPVPIRSAKGFLTKEPQPRLYFIGLDTTSIQSEILLCQADRNGLLIDTFGTHGILHTGIFLHGGPTLYSALQTPYYLLAAATLTDTIGSPFTLIKFKQNGSPDPQFAQGGFVDLPAALHPAGVTVSNDKSSIVYGGIESGGNEVSVVTKYNLNGTLDKAFADSGMAILDVDNGFHSNKMTAFTTIGSSDNGNTDPRKFIGAGISTQSSTNTDFYVARYRAIKSNVLTMDENHLSLYPNPANSSLHFESANDQLHSISIENIFGAPVYYSSQEPNFGIIDVSKFADGVYFCRIQTSTGICVKRVIVMH